MESVPAIQLDILRRANLHVCNPTGVTLLASLERSGFISTRMNHTQTYSIKKHAKVYELTEEGRKALIQLSKAARILKRIREA